MDVIGPKASISIVEPLWRVPDAWPSPHSFPPLMKRANTIVGLRLATHAKFWPVKVEIASLCSYLRHAVQAYLVAC